MTKTIIPERVRADLAKVPLGPIFAGDAKPHQIYVLRLGDLVKVGISFDAKRRLKAINYGMVEAAELVRTRRIPKYLARWTEQSIHLDLAPYHVKGEWFRCSVEVAIKAVYRCVRLAKIHDDERKRARRYQVSKERWELEWLQS